MNDSTAKHTPGPWQAEGTFVRTLRGAELDGFLVAECPTDSINYAANAAFIAAAPETAAERDRLKEINAELIGALKLTQWYHNMQLKRGFGAPPSQLIDTVNEAVTRARTMTTTENPARQCASDVLYQA